MNEPNEELAAKFRAEIAAGDGKPEGTRESLERCAKMLNTHSKDAFPANEHGQVHFARAMMESVADEITAFLSVRHCLVCDNPRDGGAIWCTDPECHRLIMLIPIEVINKVREREAYAALRASNGTAAFIHITPREE